MILVIRGTSTNVRWSSFSRNTFETAVVHFFSMVLMSFFSQTKCVHFFLKLGVSKVPQKQHAEKKQVNCSLSRSAAIIVVCVNNGNKHKSTSIHFLVFFSSPKTPPQKKHSARSGEPRNLEDWRCGFLRLEVIEFGVSLRLGLPFFWRGRGISHTMQLKSGWWFGKYLLFSPVGEDDKCMGNFEAFHPWTLCIVRGWCHIMNPFSLHVGILVGKSCGTAPDTYLMCIFCLLVPRLLFIW